MDLPSPWKPRGRARGRAIVRERSRSPIRPGGAQLVAAITNPVVSTGSAGRDVQSVEGGRPPAACTPFVRKFEGQKRGVRGDPIELRANFFQLCSVPQFTMYQFSVHFDPEEDRVQTRKALLASRSAALGVGYLFDGAILFTSTKLTRNPLMIQSERSDGTQVGITIKFVKQVQFGDFQYTQVLNIIVRKVMSLLELQLVGRNYYDPGAKIDIEQFKLQLWPGYVTSVRQHESHLLLSARVTNKVMRTDTALEKIMELQRHSSPAELRVRVADALLGGVVITAYNNRTYRVDDIDFDTTPRHSFSTSDGRSLTFIDYYRQRYQIEIREPNQPMLVSKNKARLVKAGAPEAIYLVPELCRLTGLTDDMRSNFHLMKALADRTRKSPEQHVDALHKFSLRLLQKPKIVEELDKWKMKISPTLVNFQGRVLPRESIVQGAAKHIKHQVGPQVEWTKELRTNEALAAGTLSNWVAIVPENMRMDCNVFLRELIQTGTAMKMKIADPFVEVIRNDSMGNYVNTIDAILSRTVPDVLLCFVSNNRGDRYGAIKTRCCVHRSVISQVVTNRCLKSNNRRSIATKVIQQMNCKVGGASWTTANPPALQDLMVVGVDVSKDTVNKGVAYCAIVASMDDDFAKYHSQAFECKKGDDLSKGICNGLLLALHKFQTKRGQFPNRIVFYRDGVDEFIDNTCMKEVEQMKNMLFSTYKGENYRLAYILISRRCNTRLFAPRGNHPPGTVVDDCITLPERYDFFLVSQSVRQGTVNPTSYQVLSDNTGFTACQMQRFAYKMTHLYYNWNGTVKVPAPAQYARKLSQLVGQALHRAPNAALADALYYL